MDTNSKSSSLLLQGSQPSTKVNNRNSLTLLQSVSLERASRQQQKSISRIYTAQAGIYFQERNWQRAFLACKNALEVDSHNVDAFKILGNIFKVQGKKAEALGVYAKALQINPNSAAVYANLGSFYAEQQDWQQALDYYQQAVILDPNLAGAYRSLAQVWEELGDRDRALECLCRAVDLEPEKLSSEQYFSFGKMLYRQGKIKEASIFYTHGVELDPRAESELAELVKMLEELEEWEQAVIYYHRLIGLPDSSQQSEPNQDKPIKNLLSQVKTKAQKSSCLSQRPNQKERSLKIVSTPTAVKAPQLLPTKNSEETDKSEDAAAKQPNSAASWNNLGSLYARKQQWAKAVSCYQEALQLEPNAGKTHRNLARVYDKMGQDTKANLYWYEAYSLEPEVKPEAYFNLAKGLLQQRQVDKAIACLRRAVELKPDWIEAYLILGKLLESQGELVAARTCYQKIESCHNSKKAGS